MNESVKSEFQPLEVNKEKLNLLKKKLSVGEEQLDRGEGVDGYEFMQELIE